MKNNHEALARKVAQLEVFRAEVQAICESGKHRTMHTQSQMCGFLDGIRFMALKAAVEPQPDPVATVSAELEAKAQAIYEEWSAKPGYLEWVAGGNSTMQNEARALARRAMGTA